jgi:tetraacyldisaccharide 4'-kinase
MSGQSRGLGPAILRGMLRAVEPIYSGAMRLRNGLFDRSLLLRQRKLPRPVISVGNITTGGTGKTPVVVWLCQSLQAEHRIAVLMRGYRKRGSRQSDEQLLLQESLAGGIVLANPDRFGAASAALESGQAIDLFVLDDGFQHRRVQRDFDLVLIDATTPFGYGHVLPRGMLREPLRGLGRASAVLLTRCDQVSGEVIQLLRNRIARWADAPVFQSSHTLSGVQIDKQSHAVDWLRGKRVLAFAGIGNPISFERNLQQAGAQVVSHRWFTDHHTFTHPDLEALELQAQQAGAEVLVTTQKDRVKLDELILSDIRLPIACATMAIRFQTGDDQRLLSLIRSKLPHPAE